MWSKAAGKKKAAQAILDAGGKLAMADKADMGQFWSCVFGTDTDVGMFQSGDQIQQRIESAYFTQQKTYSEHLTTDCVPKIEGARSSIAGIEKDMLPALKPPYDKYVASLPKMQAGIESYAEKLKSRGSVKDVDQSIQEVGGAFTPRRDAGVGGVREVPGVRDPRPRQEEGHSGRSSSSSRKTARRIPSRS